MALERQVYNAQNGVTGGVWRDGDVIIKRLRRTADALPLWTPSDQPRNWLYWRREADAYESDLPARLGLRGPRLLSSVPTEDGVELRVEAMDGRTAETLTTHDLRRLAFELGERQGGADLPTDPWLSRGFLRAYTLAERADHSLLEDDGAWERPYVAPFVSERARADILAMHANRQRLIALAEALPRTVCHLDLAPNNVFASDAGIGIIDWSFAGDGAIGEDIGNLVPDSVFDLKLPVSALPELEETLPAAYIAGLRGAGWRGDDRLVMLGIHASAVKYDWLAPRVLSRAGDTEHRGYGGVPVDPDGLFAARWAGLALVARWARQALAEAAALRL